MILAAVAVAVAVAVAAVAAALAALALIQRAPLERPSAPPEPDWPE